MSGREGGVHGWVPEVLSKPLGVLTAWCRSAMTIHSSPPLLAYVASTVARVVDPGAIEPMTNVEALFLRHYAGAPRA
ncbi:hypothetical protein [Kitasatospora sp. NPDC050467]|uniref:hypothetical protein n=1 Tax=unclassified Kitasatospora TaxID=2633591 RepID=UPI0037884631